MNSSAHGAPAIPPDLAFPRLGFRRDYIDFAFQAKQAAMGRHIVMRWAWDEAFQRDLHERRFGEKPFFGIRRDLAAAWHADHVAHRHI